MNESIASVFVLTIVSLLLLWIAGNVAPFLRFSSRVVRRKMGEPYFIAMPVMLPSLVRLLYRRRKRAKPRNVPQFAAQPAEVTIPQALIEAPSKATQGPPTPSIEVESPPQATRSGFRRGQDLRGERLHEQNLAGVDLSYCNLVRADLAGVDLHAAVLAYADLTNAILVGANLSGCDCTGARFHGANLQGSNLRDSDLSNTRFGPTTRPWAEVYSRREDSRYPGRTVELVGANLREADMAGANCSGSDIADARHDKALYWTQW